MLKARAVRGQRRALAAGGGDAAQRTVLARRGDDGAVGGPDTAAEIGAGEHRPRQPTRQRHPLDPALGPERDLFAVGREERTFGALRAGNGLGNESVEGSPVQPSGPLLDADVDQGASVGRNGEGVEEAAGGNRSVRWHGKLETCDGRLRRALHRGHGEAADRDADQGGQGSDQGPGQPRCAARGGHRCCRDG